MAKLYWRVKRDGKWTWVPAMKQNTVLKGDDPRNAEHVDPRILEEEE